MKSEISRDSYKPEKRYSGVYQQQGRMLTDADWNELVEILKGRLNEALKDVVGSKEGCFGGTPRHRALRIVEDAGSWKIQPGHIHVDGRAAEVPGADLMAYDAQPDFPAAPDLPVAPADDYVLYADVWERPVTYLENDYLRDVALHGADTCTRKQTMCQVKWCPAGKDPEDEKQNPRKGDAPLTVTLVQQTQQKDPCDPCAEEVQVESRIGNYLFRVEVHDVKVDANDPTKPVEITLKWSGENGAEQFAAKKKADMPDAFVTDGFVYEFFDEISEKHLGVHFTGSGNFPKRWDLIKGDTYPPTPTASFVRRWDGYCILNKSGNWKVGQNDQYDVNSSQPASISGNTLTVDLDRSLTLELTLELNHVFVAGDYWLVEVRENAIDANQTAILLDKGQPHGIGHRYLTLGKVAGGVLQPNPEADRKYAFPPLTEMTRIFSAGGDGQEAMPGQQLPQPLRVGVANGEWPVSGAKVRFSLESGDGALSISDSPFTAAPLPLAIDSADGLAQCYWQLGDGISPHAKAQCVKAELLGADGNPIPHPPIYFYANLSTADQVAYQNPTCAQSPSVNSLLGNDLGTAWPDLDGDGHVTVKDVLDALLCKLRAKHIPYDPTDAARWNDINFEEGKPLPTTVQEALDDLADNLQSEDIKYTLPDCGTNGKTFKDYLLASGIAHEMGDGADQYRIKALWNALLCKLDAATIPFSPECDYLKNQNVGTVEAALNALCEKPGQGGGCSVSVGEGGQYATLTEALQALDKIASICICLLPGTHEIGATDLVKSTVKITGCGSTASILRVTGDVGIQAREIVFRDLGFLFMGGDQNIPTAGSGSLLLYAPSIGKATVENCVFVRMFIDLVADRPWQPVVNIGGQMQLSWNNNRMSAVRNSVIAVPVTEKNPVYQVVLRIAAIDPFDVAQRDQSVTKIAADVISMVKKGTIAAADLEAAGALLNPASRGLMVAAPAGVGALDVSGFRQSLGSFATAVYGQVNNLIANKKLTQAALYVPIRQLAASMIYPDVALSLTSTAAGRISGNTIWGNVSLHYDNSAYRVLKWNDAKLNSGTKITASGTLEMIANQITTVNSHVEAEMLSIIQDGGAVNVPSYQSLTVRDNVFAAIPSSFIGEMVQVSGNQFPAGINSGDVVAYLLGNSGVVLGNQATRREAIIKLLLHQRETVANILTIDPLFP